MSLVLVEPLAGLSAALVSVALQRVAPLRRWAVPVAERLWDVAALLLALSLSASVRALTAGELTSGVRPARVGLAILAFDLVLYLLHRLNHTHAWRMHKLHHLPKHFDVGMAFRGSVIYLLGFGAAFALVAQALSLSTDEAMLVSAVFFAMQWWIHSNVWLPLGVLDWVVISPRHHALHHTPQQGGFRGNFGGLLCLWDQLGGTYRHPPRERPDLRFGLGEARPTVREWLGV